MKPLHLSHALKAGDVPAALGAIGAAVLALAKGGEPLYRVPSYCTLLCSKTFNATSFGDDVGIAFGALLGGAIAGLTLAQLLILSGVPPESIGAEKW